MHSIKLPFASYQKRKYHSKTYQQIHTSEDIYFLEDGKNGQQIAGQFAEQFK